MSNASQLTTLSLEENFLSGFIPSTLCALTNLERLSLDENNLTLDTPTTEVNVLSCLANLKNLKHLDFSKNPLNANLPISIRNFSSSLQNVYLYSCNMRDNIPDDIGNLSGLIVLSMFFFLRKGDNFIHLSMARRHVHRILSYTKIIHGISYQAKDR
ncbi:putative non-specific serine/threonine protein kinase [Rosa chinensis]|uniref:Putative non-specific serine/threonine protein kinase n=1 Tax=Rosa chinensis TaxID=74649 RepID=A0A2P6Q4R8_ROSCH|nr:putative non-specific serine/threonine protein kinase [Rosa chinensis]